MLWLRNKKIIAVHDGVFHADDVFSVATVALYLKVPIKIIRTRDETVFSKADYILDVGMEYKPQQNKFDHHQLNPDGIRPNGIPFATFGMIWKKYGEQIAGSKEAADIIDKKFVVTIDAVDNTLDIYKKIYDDVEPYSLADYILDLNPTWNDKSASSEKAFLKAVDFAKDFLRREINRATDQIASQKKVAEAYGAAKDKRVMVLDDNYLWQGLIDQYPEVLLIIRPVKDSFWHITCVAKPGEIFQTKILFPAEWAGLEEEEISTLTDVSEAIFCHRDRFLVKAKTKEAALKLAEMAIEKIK